MTQADLGFPFFARSVGRIEGLFEWSECLFEIIESF